MSEPNINGRKRLIVILIAAAVALAVILGVCLYFALGGQPSTEPTEPKPTTGGNTFVPDPTDPTEEPLEMLFHCICGSKTEVHLEGCDGSEHPWKAWTATDSLPTVSGKYYLTADVNLVPVADITTSETIYLDLNGFNINSPTRVYRMAINETEVSLTILDSVGTSVVTLTEHANAASFVLLNGTGNKTFTLYGGTIDGSALKADPTDKNGGVIRAGTTPCTVNIHGGTVIGAATAKFGGTIYVEHGTLNMTGGELKNGHALNGGNIFAKDATVAISGGKISGGVAEGAENSRGGNIFNNNAKITIAGTAEIFDGKATYLGANVFSVAGSSIDNSGKIYMTDGSDAGIYPVPDEPEDANHMSCICGSKTATHLAGCDGTKYAWRPWKQGTTLPSTSGRYYLTSDVKIDLTVVVSSAADIYLDLNGKTITATNRVYLLNAAKTDIGMTVLDSVGGGKVVMSDYAEGATFAAIGNTGNKVLTINGGTFDASKISAETANGGIIRVGSETSTLNLNAGTLIGAAKVNNGGTVHINGGAMTMTGGEIKDGHANNGGNVFLNGGSFTMTGGKVSGGVAEGAENSRGGNIFNNVANVTISGTAEVLNGTAVLGNNVFNSADSKYTNTGKVTLANGDPGVYPVVIAPEDTNHMACICGSKTDKHLAGCDGEKVAWRPWDSTVSLPTISGRYYLTADVTLENIQTIEADANVFIDLNGKTINRGTADRIFNLTLTDKTSKLTVTDSVGTGKIELTDSEAIGALVLLNSGDKEFTMYGGAVNGEKIATKGNGAVIRNVNQKVNIHGGTIIGGKAIGDGNTSGNGGAVYNGGTMTVTGGHIKGGIAVNGGVIYNAGKLEITKDAKIGDGTASNLGHNICNAASSTFANEGEVYLTAHENAFGIYPARVGCVCGSKTETHLPGCDGTKVNWSEWTKTDSLPVKTGNYFLTQDVTLKAINLIETDAAIALDLNGMKVTLDNENADSASLRVYNIITNNTTVNLTVLDSVGTGVVDLGKATSMGAFAIIHEAQDATDEAPDGKKTVTIYGGKFDGSNAVACDNGNGGVVIRNVNQTLNIHGGEFIGGTADTLYAEGDDGEVVIAKSTFGGTLWSGGVLNITDGKIYGGSAYKGGNIYINAGSFTMSGGKIYDGTVINQGGNIYVNSGSVEISGGEIHDGTASENSGGNIYIKAAEFTMTDGKVYKGTAQNGGNIFVTEGGIATISGGSVYEGTATASNGRGGNIFSTATGALTITAGDIYDGVAPAYGANIFCAEGSSFENAGNVYFTGETGDYRGVYPARIGCICGSTTDDHLAGCEGEAKFWREWNDSDKLPNTNGYWILTCDVNVSDITKIGNKANVYIDLNGKTVYRDGASRIFGLNDNNVSVAGGDFLSLTILDSAGNGTFELGNGTDTGTFLLLNTGVNKTFTMYGGTINGSDVSLGNNHGAVIRNIGHTVNIHGGTINGGSITIDSKFGGAIHSTGALNITGGTISGGRAASYGGNIFIAGGSFSMTGGSVLDGTAGTHGANICISAVNAGGFELTANAVVGFTDPALSDMTGVSAKYTIAHKQQNLADDSYGDYVAPVTVYGTVNTLTEATANTYEGFTAKTIEQKLVAGDCSTIVEVLYDRNVYSINWIADGNTVKSESLKFGAAIVAPADPEKAGFRFEGWDVAVPATMPAQDLTITAILVSEASHTVTFNSNGGTAVGNQAVVNGTVITKPADPTRIYSTFAGWYSDSALTTEWNFDTPVSGDTTLYAKWTDAVTWTLWTDATKLPDGSDGAVYYRLNTDVDVTAAIELTANTNIVIDLNGATVYGKITTGAKSIYTLNAADGNNVTLSVWSSTGTGSVELGANFFVDIKGNGTSTFNMQGGTINGGTFSGDNGGVIKLNGSNNSVNMTGGIIKGANVGVKNGGAAVVNSDATFNMMGGKIYGGQAQNGGNFIIYGGRLIVTGGEICDGVATGANNSRGGNIFCNAAVIISGGSIYDGVANTNDANAQYRASGNIFVGSGKYLLSATNPNVAFDTTVVSNVYFTTDGEKDTAKGNGIFKA